MSVRVFVIGLSMVLASRCCEALHCDKPGMETGLRWVGRASVPLAQQCLSLPRSPDRKRQLDCFCGGSCSASRIRSDAMRARLSASQPRLDQPLLAQR